mmetsp:Transcript_10434/g.22910  ORF Transcript_10434/g.22910 Transcript_10434/m.22910 type:complete len:232 (-) Transcript_10434:292-987(-)
MSSVARARPAWGISRHAWHHWANSSTGTQATDTGRPAACSKRSVPPGLGSARPRCKAANTPMCTWYRAFGGSSEYSARCRTRPTNGHISGLRKAHRDRDMPSMPSSWGRSLERRSASADTSSNHGASISKRAAAWTIITRFCVVHAHHWGARASSLPTSTASGLSKQRPTALIAIAAQSSRMRPATFTSTSRLHNVPAVTESLGSIWDHPWRPKTISWSLAPGRTLRSWDM